MRRRRTLVPLEGVIGAGPALPESVGQPASMVLMVDGEARQTLEQARTRLVVVAAVFGLALLVVGLRLVDLAVFGDSAVKEAHIAPAAPLKVRSDIVDRNGHVLATSIATASLIADPTSRRTWWQ